MAWLMLFFSLAVLVWGVFAFSLSFLVFPCLALPCLALPCLALPCLALPCLALPFLSFVSSLRNAIGYHSLGCDNCYCNLNGLLVQAGGGNPKQQHRFFVGLAHV